MSARDCQAPFFAGDPSLITLMTPTYCPHPSRFGLWMRRAKALDEVFWRTEPDAVMCGTHRNALKRRLREGHPDCDIRELVGA